jgi:hypothetical protein
MRGCCTIREIDVTEMKYDLKQHFKMRKLGYWTSHWNTEL